MAKAKVKKDVTVTLKMTEEEAASLAALLGASNVGSYNGPGRLCHGIYTSLNEAGFGSFDHELTKQYKREIMVPGRWKDVEDGD